MEERKNRMQKRSPIDNRYTSPVQVIQRKLSYQELSVLDIKTDQTMILPSAYDYQSPRRKSKATTFQNRSLFVHALFVASIFKCIFSLANSNRVINEILQDEALDNSPKPFASIAKENKHHIPPRTLFLNTILDNSLYLSEKVIGRSGEIQYNRDLYALGYHFNGTLGRTIDSYPAPFSDVTQFYSTGNSADPPLSENMERKKFPQHEVDNDCVPIAEWQQTSNPSCNTFHEIHMLNSVQDRTLNLFGMKGFWRYAWSFENEANKTPIVLKTLKFERNFEDAFFESNRVDGISMDQLTSSPYVIDIYGFCGMSMMTEFADGKFTDLMRKASQRQKLVMARQIAEGLEAVHKVGNKGYATLVHNDINMANIVVSKKGVPMLNDFNIGVLMMKNRKTQEQCGFVGRFPNPQWKAPEEQVKYSQEPKQLLTEKVDIYALGNIYYRMLTGFSPWKTHKGSITQKDKEKIVSAKLKGVQPPIPKNIQSSRDVFNIALVKLLNDCYEFSPAKRPTASEIVVFLESAIDRMK